VSASASGEGQREENAECGLDGATGGRSPLARLLHALNQPLTGLQCSMEVALAGARTPEQYRQGLRDGLELTGRMRALVEALREVADGVEEKEEKNKNKDKNENKNENKEPETTELKTLLRDVVDDLQPVAGMKGVRITLDCAASSVRVNAGRQKLLAIVFRFLEAALSLADGGSAIEIESGGRPDEDEAWIRVRWHGGLRQSEFSRPELGLLVAQAGWESVGGRWERERTENLVTENLVTENLVTENLETVTVRLPRVAANGSGADVRCS
jgi:hypothetical protein